MTILSEAARREHIEEKLDARDGGSEAETLSIRLHGERNLLPVLSVNVHAVVLNPGSHRIQAELESHEQRELVESDPFSAESQSVISDLLRNTDEYEDLRQNLKEEGQRQPGLVTRSGLLVNANRRTVALRENEEDFLRVAVLPPGLTPLEIDLIESDLQLAREFLAEYTFTNRLLFINDWREKHEVSDEKLARMLNFAASEEPRELAKGAEEVRREARLLALVRDVQAMSGGAIKLTFFNQMRQTLIEIDSRYERERSSDPSNALRLRNSRLIALFLSGSRYELVRRMEEGFFEEYFVPALEAQDLAEDLSGAFRRGSGSSLEELDVLGGDDGSPDEIDPQAILSVLSQSVDQDVVEIDVPDKGLVQIARDALLETLDDAMSEALDELKDESGRENRLKAPIDRARDAESKLRRAQETWRRVRSDANFDQKRFEAHVAKSARLAKSLHDEVKEYMGGGEG